MSGGLRSCFLALVLTTSVAIAQPTSHKLSCASCHREEADHQPHTPMGRAIELPPDQTVLESHPLLTFEKNGFSYRIGWKSGQSTYTVTDGRQTLTLPIRYAFGAGMETFVLEHDDHLYESLVSYYPALAGLSITMGDEELTPHTLVEAMGRQLQADEVTVCFGCHSSGLAANHPTRDSFVPGLTCEHCHKNAQAHLDAFSRGQTGVVPKKLGGLGAEETSAFCGACHRTFDAVVRMRAFGPQNVRFQPYRLAKSPCFNGADPRIGCTACHNPHRDLVTDSVSYDAKCLACHNGGPHTATCPVAKSNCVSCHMPKTELPGSHTQFTDHFIRVVKPNEPYPE